MSLTDDHKANAEAIRKHREKFNGSTLNLPERKGPYVVGDIEPYLSPVTGKPVTSRKEHRYDLESNGCRVYEGRQQEQAEADKFRAAQDAKMEETLDKCVNETYYGLRDGTVSPSTDEKISWTFGE